MQYCFHHIPKTAGSSLQLRLSHREHIGQLPNGSIDLIQDEDEAKNYDIKNLNQIAYVTQTTLSVDDTKNIIKILKERFPNIKEPLKEDICYATTNRPVSYTHLRAHETPEHRG